MQRVALLQRARQAQHFGPVLQVLVRAQRDALHMDLARALRLQLGDGLQRAVGVAGIDQQLGHRHQPGLLALGIGNLRHPGIAPVGFLHPVRGARADQRGGLGLVLPRLGLARAALGAGEAAGEQVLDRLAQRRLRLAHAAALAVGGGAARHVAQMADGGHHRPDHEEQQQQQGQRQVQRQLDAVRRIEQHHIAVVELREQRQPDGAAEQDRNPEQKAHGLTPSSGHAARPGFRTWSAAAP
ncbi:hypothetical protein D3C72_1174220 [compost metagenome]